MPVLAVTFTTTAVPVTTTVSVASTTTTTQIRLSTTLNFVAGWNLVGLSSSASVDVASAFGDASKLTTVWKWVPSKSGWAFYAPSLAGQQLTDYATSKGYDVLTGVNAGEGFWVNAKTAFAVQMPAGTTVVSASFRTMLMSGWNLISIGDNKMDISLQVVPARGMVTVLPCSIRFVSRSDRPAR